MLNQFHLSPRGSGGVSCDEGGAFVGAIPLLDRMRMGGQDKWRSRAYNILSREMSAQYGLAVDMSSKKGGLSAIAKALNEGDVFCAQVATALLGLPNPAPLSNGAPSRQEMVKLASDLRRSGILKADWDPGQYPSCSAGAPAGNPSASHSSDSKQNIPDDDLCIYASCCHSVDGARLIDAAIPMDGRPITAANPVHWENIKWLADGAFELSSGQIITATALWEAMSAHTERAAVSAAIRNFDFDPTRAADVLAARAYAWAQSYAPSNYSEVPWSGPQLESVSRSIMAVELARPGTLHLALRGNELSARYIRVAVESGMSHGPISGSQPRSANLPAALRTSTAKARAALDQVRPHHLIPPNVWEEKLDLAMLASHAGWRPDSIENLIALPADKTNQARMAAENGLILPIHRWRYPDYDWTVLGEIALEEQKVCHVPTPARARAIFEHVAKRMERLIRAGAWMPEMR